MYSQYYALDEKLQAQARIIVAKLLYNFDDDRVYAAHMDMLAQPLPDGSESPFSSKDPGSGHALLMAVLTHLQHISAHELNLVPDRLWIEWFRVLGAEVQAAEYPVINLIFQRSQAAIAANAEAVIPLNTEVRSRLDPKLSAYTLYEERITGNTETVTVPARLNRLGVLKNLQAKEFTVLPSLLSFIAGVDNAVEFVSPGRAVETLSEAVVRIRDGIRSGSLGRDQIDGNIDPTDSRFHARCVTASDFSYWAKRLGADKANVLSGVQYGVDGRFDDLTTVVVYPATRVDLIRRLMSGMVLESRRLDVRAAEIIPIDGTIQIRVIASVPDYEVFNLVATAIAGKVNPPYGIWGDQNFPNTLATGLEQTLSIYAVPEINLKHAFTGELLADLEIQPWNLLEVQQSLTIQVLR